MILRVPSSAHLDLGFMVPRQNSDRNEFDKTAVKIPYFHRKFGKKDVGREVGRVHYPTGQSK